MKLLTSSLYAFYAISILLVCLLAFGMVGYAWIVLLTKYFHLSDELAGVTGGVILMWLALTGLFYTGEK